MAILKNGHFAILLHLHENQPKLLGYQGWVEILMITLIYSKRVIVRNNLLHSVPKHCIDNYRRRAYFYKMGNPPSAFMYYFLVLSTLMDKAHFISCMLEFELYCEY